MIALKVIRNGKAQIIAGADDMCVLNVVLTVLGKLGERSYGVHRLRDRLEGSLRVGGTTNRGSRYRNEFVDWVDEDFGIGDVLAIELIETTSTDEPVKRKPIIETRKLMLPLRRKHARRPRGAYIRRHSREALNDYD